MLFEARDVRRSPLSGELIAAPYAVAAIANAGHMKALIMGVVVGPLSFWPHLMLQNIDEYRKPLRGAQGEPEKSGSLYICQGGRGAGAGGRAGGRGGGPAGGRRR